MNDLANAVLTPDGLKDKTIRLKEQVGQTAMLAKDVAGEGLKTMNEKATALYQASADKAVALKDSTLGYVRENPIKTALLAIGIGAIAGLLLARRR